jgi:hypothetical protein
VLTSGRGSVIAWRGQFGVECHYIVLSKPMKNGYVESFNGLMPYVLLMETLFMSIARARGRDRWLDRVLQPGESTLCVGICQAGGAHRRKG